MKTTLVKAACGVLGALLATAVLPGCEQQPDEQLVRAQKDGQARAAANLAAHEKRLRRLQR